MKPVTISLSKITKEYTIHHEKPTLLEKIVKNKYERFLALHNVNLTISAGDRVGILGPNGSGKTTLLKIIAGITTPTKGNVIVYGKLVSLIDLEAGFNMDLTGEQNIYLNGIILGMKRKELQQKITHIIRYADIKQFIDAPMFTYSQGMKLRLGLSIAIHTDPDTLVLDEGLGTGDENFRKKVAQTLQTKFKEKTIIIATHNLEVIAQQCNRILIMRKGSIVRDGGLETIKYYEKNITS